MKIFFYTGFALTAFAFNSILCRLALGTQAIEAASFTAGRLMSGALTLLITSYIFNEKEDVKETVKKRGNRAFRVFSFCLRDLFFVRLYQSCSRNRRVDFVRLGAGDNDRRRVRNGRKTEDYGMARVESRPRRFNLPGVTGFEFASLAGGIRRSGFSGRNDFDAAGFSDNFNSRRDYNGNYRA
jgi:hypothetical protein